MRNPCGVWIWIDFYCGLRILNTEIPRSADLSDYCLRIADCCTHRTQMRSADLGNIFCADCRFGHYFLCGVAGIREGKDKKFKESGAEVDFGETSKNLKREWRGIERVEKGT